jgi:hypothetical protein
MPPVRFSKLTRAQIQLSPARPKALRELAKALHDLWSVSRSASLIASALRVRNLSSLMLVVLGWVFSAPALVCIGLLVYVAAVAADRRRALAAELPPPQALGDFEVRLAARSLVDARAAAMHAVALASPSLGPEVAALPARLAEVEEHARPLVLECDRLGCFLFYRARRPELERESRQLAAEITRAPAGARREYEAAREIVLHQLHICDELSAERERLLAVLTHIAALLRAVPLELARLSLHEARLGGACDERPARAPLEAMLAQLAEASGLRRDLQRQLVER